MRNHANEISNWRWQMHLIDPLHSWVDVRVRHKTVKLTPYNHTNSTGVHGRLGDHASQIDVTVRTIPLEPHPHPHPVPVEAAARTRRHAGSHWPSSLTPAMHGFHARRTTGSPPAFVSGARRGFVGARRRPRAALTRIRGQTGDTYTMLWSESESAYAHSQ